MLNETTSAARPLCVDMDGTLLATDSLWESVILLLKRKPLDMIYLSLWLFRGKAFVKSQIAKVVRLDPGTLPYREPVLSFLKREREAGRDLVLASASDQQVVEDVAKHLGLFSAALGSDGKINLSGKKKLLALEKHLGKQEFDYIGNSTDDIPIWACAHRAILVNASARVLARVERMSSSYQILVPRANYFPQIIRAFRVHQWIKNALLFVPLLMAHRMMELHLVLEVVEAFVAFGLSASSIYIMNDLLDLEADRKHPTKWNRPFASGALQIPIGMLLIPLMLMGAISLALLLLPVKFTIVLGLYVIFATAYSFKLKNILIVDVLLLAGLYTLRVVAGGVAVGIAVSAWLLAFSMFLFLSLAFLKRYSDLCLTQELKQAASDGRKYVHSDIDLLRSVGPSSGYMAMVVLALYINSLEVMELYPNPALLWLIVPCMLYWITRMWFMAHRGKMSIDPILFAVKDLHSYMIGVLIFAIIALASV